MSYAHIYAVVRRIPRVRVASYGQIARLADLPGHARQVGYALAALPDENDVPWQRVINARGEVSPRATPGFDDLQRVLLEREGVVFDAKGRVSLARFAWQPGGAPRCRCCESHPRTVRKGGCPSRVTSCAISRRRMPEAVYHAGV